MHNENLKNIKFNSILSIFNSIATSRNISRADISKKTNLSVVTVGKIADVLLDKKVIVQAKAPRPTVGRRAGVLNVNRTKYTIILDLTSYTLKAYAIDNSFRLIDTYICRYDTLTSYPDNLNYYIKYAKTRFFKKFGQNNCIGVGVTVPGIYDKESDTVRSPHIPEIIVLPIKDFISGHFPENIVYVESNAISAGRLNLATIDSYKSKDIVYLHIDDLSICGAHFINGEVITGKHGSACDFGRMILDVDLTLDERIALCKNESDCASIISRVIYNLTRIISPHAFILEYAVKYKTGNLNELIRQQLIQKFKMPSEYIPELLQSNYKLEDSYCGLVTKIAEIWLKKILTSEN